MSKHYDIKSYELHIPVLLNELVNSIKINANKKNIVVDCTLGMWWHAIKMLEKMNSWDIFIWFDADKRNFDIAKNNIEKKALEKNIEFFYINDNFKNLKSRLEELGITKITWIYYDFWISSLHIDDWQRWFSFKIDWPLDMRFNENTWITASQIVNSYSKDDLIKIFREYGEEPSSKKIAESIVETRKTGFRFNTTKELADLIWKISKFPKSKTRIFQALRIEVNKELEAIEESLKDAIELLDKNWNIFVISFHSLEDRIVKNIFKTESKDCICMDLICSCKHKKQIKILNKKPILPTENEIKLNPRSRSAKARYVVKI